MAIAAFDHQPKKASSGILLDLGVGTMTSWLLRPWILLHFEHFRAGQNAGLKKATNLNLCPRDLDYWTTEENYRLDSWQRINLDFMSLIIHKV